MLRKELQDVLLRQLALVGASALTITNAHTTLSIDQAVAKLDSMTILVASFAQPEDKHARPTRLELVEHAARALRACYRHFKGDSWPEVTCPEVGEQGERGGEGQRLILARIQQFLTALLQSGPFHQQVLLLRGRLIASAVPLQDVEEVQLDLLNRQLDRAGAEAVGTAHAELVREEMYARSFWYGAALIGFCSGDYAIDFARHHSKMVSRELSTLLAMLDDGPNTPVKEAPP